MDVACEEGSECRGGACRDVNECVARALGAPAPRCPDGHVCLNNPAPEPYHCIPDPCALGEVWNVMVGACEAEESGCFGEECKAGYECDARAGGCVDVDECSLVYLQPPCGRGERCVNEPGAFRCEAACAGVECASGFQCQGGACVDVDECSLVYLQPLCDEREACFNTPGAYECRVDWCAAAKCAAGEVCEKREKKGECVRDWCASMRCEPGYACENKKTKGRCKKARAEADDVALAVAGAEGREQQPALDHRQGHPDPDPDPDSSSVGVMVGGT
eukprot:139102-Rhodomonas_salina.1